MESFLWIILLLPIPVQVDGQTCLSWRIQQNSTILTCKCVDLFRPLSFEFINPLDEKVAYCNSYGRCYTQTRLDTKHNISTKEVTLKMDSTTGRDINGQWKCICRSFHWLDEEDSVNVSLNILYEKKHPTVRLISPKCSKANEKLFLTCKVKGKLSVLKATIFQNGKIYAHMNRTANGCISSRCPANNCYCSDDGSEYVFTHSGISRTSWFKCVVDFESSETVMSNCAAVELPGAEIILSSPLPLTAGTLVDIKCILNRYYIDLDFSGSFKCRNVSTYDIRFNGAQAYLQLMYNVSLFDNRTICRCHVEDLHGLAIKMDAEIQLQIRGLSQSGRIIYYVVLPLISCIVLILLSVTIAMCLNCRCKNLQVTENNDMSQAVLAGDHYETIDDFELIPNAGSLDNNAINTDHNDEISTHHYFEPINEEKTDDDSNYSNGNSETNIRDINPAITEGQYRNTYNVLVIHESQNHEYEQSENLLPEIVFSRENDNDYIDTIHQEQKSNASSSSMGANSLNLETSSARNNPAITDGQYQNTYRALQKQQRQSDSHEYEYAFQSYDVPASENDNIGEDNSVIIAETPHDHIDATIPSSQTWEGHSGNVDGLETTTERQKASVEEKHEYENLKIWK